MANKAATVNRTLYNEISSTKGPPLLRRPRIDVCEEPAPVQAGATGIGELRLNSGQIDETELLPAESTASLVNRRNTHCYDYTIEKQRTD